MLKMKSRVAAGFLMSLPPEMVLHGDTLIVGSFTNSITLVNKNTVDVYWSKGLNTPQSFLQNGEIVYEDEDCSCVKKISLASGATTFQSDPTRHTNSHGQSYIYNNTFTTV